MGVAGDGSGGRRAGAGGLLRRVLLGRELRRVVLAVLVAVATTGVMFGSSGAAGTGPPPIEDVPGTDDRAGGVPVAAVERALLDGINDARAADGQPRLSRSDRLAAAANYHNRRRMILRHGDGPVSTARFDVRCSRTATTVGRTIGAPDDGPAPFEAANSATDVATAIMYELVEADPLWEKLAASTVYAAGVDVHVAPDGSVAVRIVLC